MSIYLPQTDLQQTETPPGFVLEMQNISKSFAGVVAVDQVNLSLRAGECLALIGENGAGKSTLMKILSGVYQKDGGRILVRGVEANITDTRSAHKLGIAIIHQEFNLVEYLTVADNIFLGRESTHSGLLLNHSRAASAAQQVLDKLGAPINARKMIFEITTGEKQLVEIARALSQDASVLVMDEPTASLTKKEIDILFHIIRTLKAQGVGIIYISHRLEEIYDIADRVCVLRNGRNAGETSGKAPIAEIVEMMLGREIGEKFHKQEVPVGETILEVRDLSAGAMLRNINLSVKQGEIVGVFGIAGAGQRELALALFGLHKLLSGQILVNGKPARINSPADAIRNKLGLLTENRKIDGLLLELSILHNITLSYLEGKGAAPAGYISDRKEKAFARSFFDKLSVRASSIQQQVKHLSGGNQQKVVLARALSTRPDVIILNEPTRGVDVGAKVEIYDLMSQMVSEGKGLILISSELPEVLGMSDRVLVMYRGSMVAEIPRSEATQQLLLTYAMGGNLVPGNI
ncbi:MAG TPA: sugar ABC transporter ATP-binding protein [Chloroflexia bacterium]|nr:sugar ABC transporter ATP-binding protein [Chloroflexia bacterium]